MEAQLRKTPPVSPSVAWCPTGEHPHTPRMLLGTGLSAGLSRKEGAERDCRTGGGPQSSALWCHTLLQPRDTWLSVTHLPALPGRIQSPSTATLQGQGGGLRAALGQLATPQCGWALGPSFLRVPTPFEAHVTHPHQEPGCLFGLIWGFREKLGP